MNSKIKRALAGITAAIMSVTALNFTAYASDSAIITQYYDIPTEDTSFKSYMDYRTITDTASAQYELQQIAVTDSNGLRKHGDYYLVAMGTYYTETVGSTFKITLESGNEFQVMAGDIKSNSDTDKTNMYSPVYDQSGYFISANVIEFIVDTDEIDPYIKKLGTISGYEDFKGNITKIERIENKEE